MENVKNRTLNGRCFTLLDAVSGIAGKECYLLHGTCEVASVRRGEYKSAKRVHTVNDGADRFSLIKITGFYAKIHKVCKVLRFGVYAGQEGFVTLPYAAEQLQ